MEDSRRDSLGVEDDSDNKELAPSIEPNLTNAHLIDTSSHICQGRSEEFHDSSDLESSRLSSTPRTITPDQSDDDDDLSGAYYVAEVSALIYNYPTVWGTADILANDTDARNLYNSIEPSIPTDVAVKAGTRAGDFSNVTYSSSDPDCWWTYGQAGSKCSVPKHSGIPTDITICDEPRTWGLSFDDGPNCTHNAFYDYLQSKNQKATMCYIGSNVLNWPYQAQRGLTDGHHIISHTWSHPYMTALTNTEVFAELYYSTKAIKEVTGVTVEAWRPPYGDVDDRVRAIATGLGLSTVLWSADTDDWMVEPEGTLPRSTIESNYATIINNVSDTIGNIVLTHEIVATDLEPWATLASV